MVELSRNREALRNELMRLRDLAGISGREMARRLGINQSRIVRIDSGAGIPSMPEAEKWLDACHADGNSRERVLAALEAAMGETRPWSSLLEGETHLQEVARRRNLEATVVRNFQPTVIPGLLQTAGYAHSVLALGRTDVAAAVVARMERQQVLHEPGRRFEFVIAEKVLHWAPGPRALAGQRDHLLSLATLESVELAILPDEAAPVVPWHNFVIREPADGSPTYVTTELIHGAQEVVAPDSVAVYETVWKRLWDAAAHGDAAAALIRGGG